MLLGKFGRIGAVAFVLLMAGLGTSQAQISPFGRPNRQAPGLVQGDKDMMFAAEEQLNNEQAIHPGDKRDWHNPQSGNSGSVRVLRLFTDAGAPCHSLAYDVSYKAKRPGRTYTLNWCKTKDGAWKIKS
jgi:surface antigen